MNTQILQKCIEELKQDKPKIDYILGMLETVVAMSNNVLPTYPPIYSNPNGTGGNGIGYPPPTVYNKSDEESFTEKYLNGPIGTIN